MTFRLGGLPLRLGGFARLIFFLFSSRQGGFLASSAEVLAFRRGGQDAEKSQNDQPTNLAAFYQLL
jgi:hypothetical protein